MLIQKIEVTNYRLLKSVTLELEEVLSLVIGKNNCGKTSLLSVLDKFLNKKEFSFEDFNIEIQKKLIASLETEITIKESEYNNCLFHINLRIHINYEEEDRLGNISKFILDLDDSIKTIILSFDYILNYDSYVRLRNDFVNFKKDNEDKEYDATFYLKKNYKSYFDRNIRSLEVGNESNFLELEDKDIKKIICFQTIGAKRGVANTEDKNGKILSKFSSEYLQSHNSKNSSNSTYITELQKKIFATDKILTEGYKTFFNDVLGNIKKFSSDAAEIEIQSTLEEIDLLKDNTCVRYIQDGHNLPEHHNGLGYMNLFAILFDVHLKLDQFKKTNTDSDMPADINLLFIEEPEAHTHPQMQYIFIRNIKDMLKEGRLTEGRNEEIQLQTIITTHSPHITSQSEFDDIKYFFRKNELSVEFKNLSDLEKSYGTEKEAFKFLKQYLTLNNAELFFADKAVLIEGDSERIILPAIMKKIDTKKEKEKGYTPLLSQNISIIETGSHAHIFAKFFQFIGIKSLLITDIDSVDDNRESVPVEKGTKSSNPSIKHFLDNMDFESLKTLGFENRILDLENKNHKGNLAIAYQTKENNYHARSFEEAFIAVNLSFVFKNKENFQSLKNKADIMDNSTDFFKIAEKCIIKKPSFASDILYYSNEDFSNWQIPAYIVEGLEWLAQ